MQVKPLLLETGQQVGEHMEKQLIWLRQQQGRDAHLEKGCGRPPWRGGAQ